jgi:hypothetical protein
VDMVERRRSEQQPIDPALGNVGDHITIVLALRWKQPRDMTGRRRQLTPWFVVKAQVDQDRRSTADNLEERFGDWQSVLVDNVDDDNHKLFFSLQIKEKSL